MLALLQHQISTFLVNKEVHSLLSENREIICFGKIPTGTLGTQADYRVTTLAEEKSNTALL